MAVTQEDYDALLAAHTALQADKVRLEQQLSNEKAAARRLEKQLRDEAAAARDGMTRVTSESREAVSNAETHALKAETERAELQSRLATLVTRCNTAEDQLSVARDEVTRLTARLNSIRAQC